MDLDVREEIRMSQVCLPFLFNVPGFFATRKSRQLCLRSARETCRQGVKVDEGGKDVGSGNIIAGKQIANVFADRIIIGDAPNRYVRFLVAARTGF
jgi:hypothetical protein